MNNKSQQILDYMRAITADMSTQVRTEVLKDIEEEVKRELVRDKEPAKKG